MRISEFGLDDLISDITRISNLPDDIKDEILHVQAEIFKEQQIINAKTMFVKNSTGITADSITIGKPSTDSKGNRTLYISFKGNRKIGKKTYRVAEIAFYNEFGTIKKIGTHFIKKAIEEKQEIAAEAAKNVFNKFIDN